MWILVRFAGSTYYKDRQYTHKCISALAPALSYPDHCPTSCWTNNYFVVAIDK